MITQLVTSLLLFRLTFELEINWFEICYDQQNHKQRSKE